MTPNLLILSPFYFSLTCLVACLETSHLFLSSSLVQSLLGMGQTHRWAPRNKQSSAAACISIVAGMDTRNRLARRPEQTYRKRNPRGEAGLAGCCAATAHRAMEDDGHGGGVVEIFLFDPSSLDFLAIHNLLACTSSYH